LPPNPRPYACRASAAAPALDEGPLVLVETRRDLRDMALPFDAPREGGPGA